MSKTAAELIQEAIDDLDTARAAMPFALVSGATIVTQKRLERAIKTLHKAKVKIVESDGFPRVER